MKKLIHSLLLIFSMVNSLNFASAAKEDGELFSAVMPTNQSAAADSKAPSEIAKEYTACLESLKKTFPEKHFTNNDATLAKLVGCITEQVSTKIPISNQVTPSAEQLEAIFTQIKNPMEQAFIILLKSIGTPEQNKTIEEKGRTFFLEAYDGARKQYNLAPLAPNGSCSIQ